MAITVNLAPIVLRLAIKYQMPKQTVILLGHQLLLTNLIGSNAGTEHGLFKIATKTMATLMAYLETEVGFNHQVLKDLVLELQDELSEANKLAQAQNVAPDQH